ncbi:hypothetical protein [Thalassovita sp.]|uniref:hypothetical protein n=1 Tax=Thalassovita sp. TaxID=1979401 RepID=UPI0029DE7841|nr:hypothetical protein [Thalassovita sp.]
MTKSRLISAACLLALGAAPALAEGVRVYAYSGVANYCPNGQQPITVNGVICCGTPNQPLTYQQAKGDWVAMRASVPGAQPKGQSMVCPEGEKGCRYE